MADFQRRNGLGTGLKLVDGHTEVQFQVVNLGTDVLVLCRTILAVVEWVDSQALLVCVLQRWQALQPVKQWQAGNDFVCHQGTTRV
ncbi:hypothetical protein D3C80_1227000 [compost metagenome]